MTLHKAFNLAVIAVATFIATALVIGSSISAQGSSQDKRIVSSAKKSYVFKVYLKDDHIKIHSDDGMVTLTGTVSEASHKSLAEETVTNLPGVNRVQNLLAVTAPPASASSDEWIAERVRGTLLFHRSVSYTNTTVTVADGKVTLKGVASSEAQKQLTGEYAKDVSGVNGVDNQMSVKEPPSGERTPKAKKVDDASITTQVRISMLYHHGADGFDTKVSTRDGVVTLTGTAKNQAEIDLATKRVEDIYGVKSVYNKMTIVVAQAPTD